MTTGKLYVQRDSAGDVVALVQSGTEALDLTQPDHAAFLAAHGLPVAEIAPDPYLLNDLKFIRVLEDLILALLDKGLLTITDLPVEAVTKLQSRAAMRKRSDDLAGLLG